MRDNVKLLLAGLLFAFSLGLTYLNHFNNGFYFDDAHTIENNEFIRDLGNFFRFFTDAATFSSLPANQAYRPLVTLSNAIDYRLAGGLNPKPFHVHIFLTYLLLCLFLFFFFRKIYSSVPSFPFVAWISMGAVAFYAFHTSNAETINYIISRSDSLSTLFCVLAFVVFQHPVGRKFGLYLIPMVMGILSKQTGVMFAPLLFLYLLLIEQKTNLLQIFKTGQLSKVKTAFVQALPALLIAGFLFVFNQKFMTPEHTLSTNTTVSKWDYFMTQFYIVTHYLGNFILPVNLSADPDFEVITRFFDIRILFGFAVVGTLVGFSFWLSANPQTLPAAFGILWFFVALLPTSSLFPLYQVANDHRTFFPYIGLVLALGNLAGLGLKQLQIRQNPEGLKIAVLVFLLIIGLHAFGTWQRNEVWGSAESLWKDVTQKSPKNARGLMNYGLVLMENKDYQGARDYFQRAYELTPYYSYLLINMAVLEWLTDNLPEAENYFKNALLYGQANPEIYFYYGKFLIQTGRKTEAAPLVKKGKNISPGHAGLNQLSGLLSDTPENLTRKRIEILLEKTKTHPELDDFLELGVLFYREGQFEECVSISLEALAIFPENAALQNNVCSGYMGLSKWKEAQEFCEKALINQPDLELAKNNLAWIRSKLFQH